VTSLSVARRATFWIGAALALAAGGFSATGNALLTDYGVHGSRTPDAGHVHPMDLKGVTVYLSPEQLAALRNANDRATLAGGVGLTLMIGALGLGWFERRSNRAQGAPPVTS